MSVSSLSARIDFGQCRRTVMPELQTGGLSVKEAMDTFKESPHTKIGPWLWNVFDGFGPSTNSSFLPVLIESETFHTSWDVLDFAGSKRLVRPTVEQAFYIARFLTNTQNLTYHFNTVAMMHEPVKCGVGVCSKIFVVYENKKVCGVMGGPGIEWKKGTKFAFIQK